MIFRHKAPARARQSQLEIQHLKHATLPAAANTLLDRNPHGRSSDPARGGQEECPHHFGIAICQQCSTSRQHHWVGLVSGRFLEVLQGERASYAVYLWHGRVWHCDGDEGHRRGEHVRSLDSSLKHCHVMRMRLARDLAEALIGELDVANTHSIARHAPTALRQVQQTPQRSL